MGSKTLLGREQQQRPRSTSGAWGWVFTRTDNHCSATKKKRLNYKGRRRKILLLQCKLISHTVTQLTTFISESRSTLICNREFTKLLSFHLYSHSTNSNDISGIYWWRGAQFVALSCIITFMVGDCEVVWSNVTIYVEDSKGCLIQLGL